VDYLLKDDLLRGKFELLAGYPASMASVQWSPAL
jgi:hypothetical protein